VLRKVWKVTLKIFAPSVIFLKKLRIKNLGAIKQVRHQNCVTLRTFPILFL